MIEPIKSTDALAPVRSCVQSPATGIMTNPNAMAVPPSTSPGLIRLRLPSQVSTNSLPPARLPQDSSPQLMALEQSLRQLIQSLLETAIMVHDLEDGSGDLLFQKMYSMDKG
jgi:hypothetical protein